MKKNILVVGAIIENNKDEILCALRSPHMSLPNSWEFPGGKVEKGEDLNTAIKREIFEELKCSIISHDIFHNSVYDYGDFIVNLITIKCNIIEGIPTANEHSKLIWLKRDNLSSLKWAPADIETVHKLINEKV